ncbi:MAG: hypothetical protein ABIH37_04670 [archaeon]
MRNLKELLEDEEGRDLLQENGIFLDEREFIRALKAPADNGSDKRVFGAQQIYLDYATGVSSKIAALKDLSDQGVRTVFIWMDTDNAGSDKLMTRFFWPGIEAEGSESFRVVSKEKSKGKDMRFVEIDPSYIKGTRDGFIGSLKTSGYFNRETFNRFWSNFDGPSNLAELNLRVTEFLIKNYFGYYPDPRILSEHLDDKMRSQLNLVFQNLDDIVRVVNEGIQDLVDIDVDPQISKRDPSYLPLHVTCPEDWKRNTLRRVNQGQDVYAVAVCKCGNNMKYHLGSKTLSADSVFDSAIWSPDVMLPILINDLYSGEVSGKSSSLYGIVLNHAMKKVLEKNPIPVLIPEAYYTAVEEIRDGLIPHYFRNSRSVQRTPRVCEVH